MIQKNEAGLSIFDNHPDGFYAINKEWRFIYINKTGVRLSKKSLKNLLGKRPQEIFPDAHVLEFGETLTLVMKDRKPRGIEAYFPRYNKWYENRIFPIPQGVGILAREITDRKKSELASLQLAEIVRNSDDAIISKNLEGIIMSWNKTAEKLFGYRQSEVVGKSIRIIIPAELQNQEDEILKRIRSGKKVDHFRTIRQAKDGHRINVSLTISPVKNNKGKIVGVSKIIRETTKDIQIENNLKFLAAASKELSASLDYKKTLKKVASLAVLNFADWCAIGMIDKKNSFQEVTLADRPQQTPGSGEVLSKKSSLRDFLDESKIARIMRTGKSKLITKINPRYSSRNHVPVQKFDLGGIFDVRSLIVSPLLSGGKPAGVIIFANSGLRKNFTGLDLSLAEEISARASLAIENTKLYRSAQVELALRKKIEQQKDEFIAIASHELKTPITALKSYAQIIMRSIREYNHPGVSDMLQRFNAQIDKLTNLINDLFDLTKIESAKAKYKSEIFLFDEFLSEIVKEMQSTTSIHKIKILGKNINKFAGDRDRIGQIITNLISNAIKYSPRPGRIIIKKYTGANSIRISVRDFGIGIPKDKLPMIFGRFFRVQHLDRKDNSSLGLGLYITKKIIDNMGGEIKVESTEGKGTCFILTLPNKSQTPEF